MKKVSIIAIVLVIIGFGAYIFGSIVVSNSLSNNATIITKPDSNSPEQNVINTANSSEAKVALNTTPTTSIAAPVVENKNGIISNNASIANPNGDELSNVLDTQSPKGYNIKSMQVVGSLTVQPYKLKVYAKPDLKAKSGYLNTNTKYVTITGEYENWYRISIGNYVGFIEKSDADISAVVNAGSEFLKCNLIGCVDGINNNHVLLNVRQSPDETSKILYTLSNAGNFNIIGAIGNYYEVDVQGEQGYVSAKYVSTIIPSIVENGFRIMDNISDVGNELASNSSYVISNAPVSLYISGNERVPVHATSSPKSTIETYLSNNERFQCTDVGNSWIKVIVDGKEGYVFTDNISNL